MEPIYWAVHPEIISIGPVTIRWYGLLFALSFLAGFHIFRWIFFLEQKPQRDLDRLLLFMMAGTVLGARLGHCLFYQPSHYLSNPVDIVKVWEGGLASHGAVVGIFTSLYIYCRKHPDQPYLWLLDRMVITVALSGLFIRLGNLFNSEILGTPTQLPWAFIFSRYDEIPRHPAQLYESMVYGGIFILLMLLYRRWRMATPPGLLLGLFLTIAFSGRILVEFVKMRQADFATEWMFSMGQWLSIPVILLGLVLLIRCRQQSGTTTS